MPSPSDKTQMYNTIQYLNLKKWLRLSFYGISSHWGKHFWGRKFFDALQTAYLSLEVLLP